MHHVQLTDQAYQEAQRRANEAGFKSVDEFVTDVLTTDVAPQTENLDHLFTSERLAHIDAALAKVKAGEYYTADEVDAHFKKHFQG